MDTEVNRSLTWCLALAIVACSPPAATTPPDEGSTAPTEPRDWVFIFHMPNDNDLDRHAESIQGAIRRGLSNDRVAATILMDRVGDEGLRRVTLESGSIEEEVLETDDSSDVAELEEYLDWASSTLPSRNYVVSLLGHGGRLDEVALDVHTGASDGDESRWASAASVADAIRRWRGRLPSEGGDGGSSVARLELLILHQCGRASIEGLHAFRDTAEIVVASETFVGAPNSYYRPVLQQLAHDPAMDGEAVARAILDVERHAAALAIFDGAALAELPERANALVDALQRPDGRRLSRPLNQLPAFGFSGEVTYDLCTYIQALAEANDLDDNEAVEGHLRWFSNELVMGRRVRHIFFPRVDSAWCGVAMYVPWTPDTLRGYRDAGFYRDSRWMELIDRLAPPRVIPLLPEVTSIAP